MPWQHDREFYRLIYPPQAAPEFISGGISHRVVDISEGGFRYAPAVDLMPLAGAIVSGILRFLDEEPVEIKGSVVRVQGGEVAVSCGVHPIPLGIVLREQRRVRRQFPFRA